MLVVHISDKRLQKQIEQLAVITGKPKETVTSEVMETGLKNYPVPSSTAAKALLELAQWAEENNVSGPADLSTNHDKYLWDEYNKTDYCPLECEGR